MRVGRFLLKGGAILSLCFFIGGSISAVWTGIEMGNSKKRAIEIVKNTEIYKYIYEQDAKEIKNTFDKAQYDYILATNKAANGEIGLEEFSRKGNCI